MIIKAIPERNISRDKLILKYINLLSNFADKSKHIFKLCAEHADAGRQTRF